MAVPLAALGVGAGLGALQTGLGIGQRRRARRIRRRAQREFERHPFETPAEALQALTTAQMQAAQTRLPGEDLLQAQLQAGTGGALEATREAAVTPQDISGAATGIYESLYVNPLRDMRIAASQQAQQNTAQYLGQLNTVAQFRGEEWQQNVLQPYLRATGTAGQLEAAGQRNIFGGIGTIAGAGLNYGLGQMITGGATQAAQPVAQQAGIGAATSLVPGAGAFGAFNQLGMMPAAR